jgi:hypothetical protein
MFPKNAVIFNALGAHNMLQNERVVNNFAVAPHIAIPADVNNLAVLEGLALLGRDIPEEKPTAFLFDKKPVNLFAGKIQEGIIVGNAFHAFRGEYLLAP